MAVLSHHDANDPVDALFDQLALPTTLRMHMYRVTALGLAVADASTVAVNVNALRRVLLVHDLGNLVKMDELDADARAVRDKMTAEYGSDDHAISEGIAQELGFDAYELDLLRRKVFINNADVQQSNDFTLKIAAYADQRVTPDGIDSLLGRLLEAKDRYVARPGSSMNRPDTNRNIELALEIERQLTAHSGVAVYDIGEANARPFLDSLPSRPL